MQSYQTRSSASTVRLRTPVEGSEQPPLVYPYSPRLQPYEQQRFLHQPHHVEPAPSDLYWKFSQDITTLFAAVQTGNTRDLLSLLNHGKFFVDVVNEQEYTPLLWSVKHNQIEAASVLLDHGASLSSRTVVGFRFHYCSIHSIMISFFSFEFSFFVFSSSSSSFFFLLLLLLLLLIFVLSLLLFYVQLQGLRAGCTLPARGRGVTPPRGQQQQQ